MNDQTVVQAYEKSRQQDINAMLLAILLIERGQTKKAQQVLMERLPSNITDALEAIHE